MNDRPIEYLWQWTAFDESKERICDAGVMWAPDEGTAEARVSLCLGGPHAHEVRHTRVRKVVDALIDKKVTYVTRLALHASEPSAVVTEIAARPQSGTDPSQPVGDVPSPTTPKTGWTPVSMAMELNQSCIDQGLVEPDASIMTLQFLVEAIVFAVHVSTGGDEELRVKTLAVTAEMITKAPRHPMVDHALERQP